VLLPGGIHIEALKSSKRNPLFNFSYESDLNLIHR
jgi:hypothetical protein